MIEEEYRSSKVEALIMASPEPLPTRKIVTAIDKITPSQVARSVADLNSGYAQAGSSFRIREIAGGYQYYILPEYEGVLESLFARKRKVRLSRAALETVAIIAYRQPATKAEVEHIRGVASDGVIRTLLERGMVTISGRSETVGKPLQYSTTDEFLRFFGLGSLKDLPNMEEIEQMISSEEARHQTELEFGVDKDGRLLKLNIADGTFDPDVRDRVEGEPEEDAEPDEVEIEVEAGLALAASLVLKKGEEAQDASETVEEPEADASEPTESRETAVTGDSQ